MTNVRRLTLEETIDAARQQGAIDEVVQKARAMSDEQIERELVADGVDVTALDARLAARAKALFETRRSLPTGARKKIAAGFGAGVAATGAVLAALAQTGVVSVTAGAPTLASTTSSPPTELEHANELRKAAFEACGRGRWQECIARFDEAKALDPRGDADAEVQGARQRAIAMIR